MRRLVAVLVGLALSFAAIVRASDDTPHVVIVSIDGLMPRSYTAPAPSRIPVLRALAAEGAWARGVVGVVPSVTYPSHTTMITGVPRRSTGSWPTASWTRRITPTARGTGSRIRSSP